MGVAPDGIWQRWDYRYGPGRTICEEALVQRRTIRRAGAKIAATSRG